MRDMTKVDGFYVGNLLGDVAATVNVTQAASGGVYPTGSVIQLVPSEVMVKHHTGFSPVTKNTKVFVSKVSKAIKRLASIACHFLFGLCI